MRTLDDIRLMDKDRRAVEAAAAILRERFPVERVILFGSKARGDSHRESDLDVLVVLEQYDWETEKAVYDLCYDIGVDYSVVIAPALYSRSEFESPLERATTFYRAVEREGVLL